MPKFISDDEMAKLEQAQPSQPKQKKVISDDEMMALEKAEADKPSELQSGLRGLAQGASFGFADEATGALEAAKDWITNNPESFMDNYKKHRDESRANYKAAEDANPKSYMTGQVGGAVGTALIPGLGGAGIGRLALQGAAQGLGSSNADLTEGDIAGAAKDTAIGAGIGAATGAAAKGIQKLLPSAERAAQGLISTAEDVSNPLANLPGGAHETVAGKLFGASNKTAQVANAIGDIPETVGAGIREGGEALSQGNLSGVLKGLGKTSGFSTLGEVGRAVGSSGAPRTAEEVSKSFGQKALDYGIGAAATGKASGGIIPGIAAASKAVGKGLDVVNKGVFSAANQLSTETVAELAPRLGKYGQVLMNAAARGGQNALASTDFVLQQTDPEYRKALRQAQGIDDEQQEEPQ